MSKLEKTRTRTKPPETTKHGLLKTDRKARHQPILAEDLATLEDLNEQVCVRSPIHTHLSFTSLSLHTVSR